MVVVENTAPSPYLIESSVFNYRDIEVQMRKTHEVDPPSIAVGATYVKSSNALSR